MAEFFMPDLDSAEVIDQELNRFAYDPADYAELQDILSSPQFNSQVVHTIDLLQLSKNGVLLKDPMQKYLDNYRNSSSALKEVLKTPFHYKFYMEMRKKAPDPDHFELGTFAHMAFLEPERFDKVIIEPDHPLNTTEGVTNMIRWYEKTNQCGNADLTGYKIADLRAYLQDLKAACPYQRIKREHQDIIDIVRYNYKTYGGGIIPRLLKGAVSEVSFYGIDQETGLPVKIRPDYFNLEENIGVNAIISFKTTSAQSLGKFFYDSAKYSYEISESMYLQVGTEITARKFTAVFTIMLQTVPPYLVAVFFWAPDDLANGKYKYHTALLTVKECQEKLSWPGYDSAAESGDCGIIHMKQPEWAARELHPVDIDE